MAAKSIDSYKKAAALEALKLVTPGMKLGLGTGSTANHFIDALAEKVKKGLDVTCVATSQATQDRGTSLGLKMSTLNEHPVLDMTVDGADEFDAGFRLIKGGGGALLMEKVVASSSRRTVIIADESKRVDVLGAFALPVEVIPFGMRSTALKMERVFGMLGMKPKMTVRMKEGKPYRTDGGHCIIDCVCREIKEPERLGASLNNIPGVVEHGMFLGIAAVILVGGPKGVAEMKRG